MRARILIKFGIATLAAVALLGSVATAEELKELKTEKGKPLVLGNLLNAPRNCSSNSGPNPIPLLREKPSHGRVIMQIVIADLPADDSCPARKIPAIALIFVPDANFIGTDSVQIELDAGSSKLTVQGFRIIVQEAS
ncbi:MAG: hypothetical protein ACLQDM_27380 [Bradyrhizobium sp.]